jgi:threonyl-tRNA synthetase
MERFIAILLEHSRKFPSWLMPEQAIILSLVKYEIYAKKVLDLLENHEIRALVDNRNEIEEENEMQKCKKPFMLIVGEEEEKMGLFLYVVMDKKEKEITVTIEEFVTIVEQRNQNIKSIYSLT